MPEDLTSPTPQEEAAPSPAEETPPQPEKKPYKPYSRKARLWAWVGDCSWCFRIGDCLRLGPSGCNVEVPEPVVPD